MTTIRETFDTIETSKTAAVRVVSYFLDGDENGDRRETFALVEYDFDGYYPSG